MMSAAAAIESGKKLVEWINLIRPAQRWIRNRLRLAPAAEMKSLLDYMPRFDQSHDWVELCDRLGNVWKAVAAESVHVTIKGITEGKVLTVGRSSAGAVREGSSVQEVVLGKSTAFRLVTGEHPLLCFVGKNLGELNSTDYENNRPEFKRYYCSAAVFPIYEPSRPVPIGFLTFDSPDAKGFTSLPNYFAERNELKKYNRKLEVSAAFHTGRTLARLVADALWRYKDAVDRPALRGGRQVAPVAIADHPPQGDRS